MPSCGNVGLVYRVDALQHQEATACPVYPGVEIAQLLLFVVRQLRSPPLC